MTPAQVLAQLLDLPPTFKRPGVIFTQIYNSLAAGEASYALASDGSIPPQTMPRALGPWLTVWGQIFGIPRLAQEADLAYSARIRNSLTSPVGTPQAIQAWSRYFLNSTQVTVVENLNSGVGYVIEIPAGLPTQLLENWLESLDRIRPAGVPFSVVLQTNPLMLGTYSYIGASRFAAAYLGFGTSSYNPSFDALTPNAEPLISTVLLDDPSLNGGLVLGLPT